MRRAGVSGEAAPENSLRPGEGPLGYLTTVTQGRGEGQITCPETATVKYHHYFRNDCCTLYFAKNLLYIPSILSSAVTCYSGEMGEEKSCVFSQCAKLYAAP